MVIALAGTLQSLYKCGKYKLPPIPISLELKQKSGNDRKKLLLLTKVTIVEKNVFKKTNIRLYNQFMKNYITAETRQL